LQLPFFITPPILETKGNWGTFFNPTPQFDTQRGN
jgi:hypothetical protein